MNSNNGIFNALLHLGYEQLKDGLYDMAVETFSAAHMLNSADDRALRGRELAASQGKVFVSLENDPQ